MILNFLQFCQNFAAQIRANNRFMGKVTVHKTMFGLGVVCEILSRGERLTSIIDGWL